MSDGHRTSSIPRPRARRGAAQGTRQHGAVATAPRRTRTTSSVTTTPRHPDHGKRHDFTRPIPRDARVVERPQGRFALALLATLIVAAITAALVVLPVRAWLNQRDELAAKRAELATLEQANVDLQGDIDRLQTPEGVEDAAREELGYVLQGETRVASSGSTALPTDLPDGWPYSLVDQIVAARSAIPAVPVTPGG